MTTARVILVNFPSLEIGKKIARELLENELVKCVNLLPKAESLYLWEGKVEEDGEVIGLMKSTSERVEALESRYLELHPYEVPEFLVLSVEAGGQSYLDWLGALR